VAFSYAKEGRKIVKFFIKKQFTNLTTNSMITSANLLLEFMQHCVNEKKAGTQGNFQGLLNQCRQIFDTTFKNYAGRYPELLQKIAEAQRLQMEGQRIVAAASVAANEAGEQRKGPKAVNMADAFAQQKKRSIHPAAGVKPPRKVQPKPDVEISEGSPEGEVEENRVLDGALANELLNLPPAAFRDKLGGAEGLEAFASELFGLHFESGTKNPEIVRAVKDKIRRIVKQSEE
jgi:hypothetical protein